MILIACVKKFLFLVDSIDKIKAMPGQSKGSLQLRCSLSSPELANPVAFSAKGDETQTASQAATEGNLMEGQLVEQQVRVEAIGQQLERLLDTQNATLLRPSPSYSNGDIGVIIIIIIKYNVLDP